MGKYILNFGWDAGAIRSIIRKLFEKLWLRKYLVVSILIILIPDALIAKLLSSYVPFVLFLLSLTILAIWSKPSRERALRKHLVWESKIFSNLQLCKTYEEKRKGFWRFGQLLIFDFGITGLTLHYFVDTFLKVPTIEVSFNGGLFYGLAMTLLVVMASVLIPYWGYEDAGLRFFDIHKRVAYIPNSKISILVSGTGLLTSVFYLASTIVGSLLILSLNAYLILPTIIAIIIMFYKYQRERVVRFILSDTEIAKNIVGAMKIVKG